MRCHSLIWCFYLLVSLGGHGQVEPVENIVDLLALHLGLDASRQEPVAGLENAAQLVATCRKQTSFCSSTTACRRLTSFLTCMTPSSVSVLVSMTRIPSAERSAKIFWQLEVKESQDRMNTLTLIVKKAQNF